MQLSVLPGGQQTLTPGTSLGNCQVPVTQSRWEGLQRGQSPHGDYESRWLQTPPHWVGFLSMPCRAAGGRQRGAFLHLLLGVPWSACVCPCALTVPHRVAFSNQEPHSPWVGSAASYQKAHGSLSLLGKSKASSGCPWVSLGSAWVWQDEIKNPQPRLVSVRPGRAYDLCPRDSQVSPGLCPVPCWVTGVGPRSSEGSGNLCAERSGPAGHCAPPSGWSRPALPWRTVRTRGEGTAPAALPLPSF